MMAARIKAVVVWSENYNWDQDLNVWSPKMEYIKQDEDEMYKSKVSAYLCLPESTSEFSMNE